MQRWLDLCTGCHHDALCEGFEIDRQKIANLLKIPNTTDPLVEGGIRVVVGRLNRDAYIKIMTEYEPPGPDGKRHLALVIVLEIDNDEERLRRMELGTIDELPFPILLWDRMYGNFPNDVS